MAAFMLFLSALPQGDAEPQAAPKIIAQGRWAYANADVNAKMDAKQFVLKSAADLVAVTPYKDLDALPAIVEKQATTEMATTLKVKDIDWGKQMLIVVTGGTKPTGGYRVEVTDLKVKDKQLVVTWKIEAPKGIATDAFTHPATVVLVPKFDGKVVFEQSK